MDPSAIEWKKRTALTSLSDNGSVSSIRLAEIEQMESKPNGKHSSAKLAPLLCYACLTTMTPTNGRDGDGMHDGFAIVDRRGRQVEED